MPSQIDEVLISRERRAGPVVIRTEGLALAEMFDARHHGVVIGIEIMDRQGPKKKTVGGQFTWNLEIIWNEREGRQVDVPCLASGVSADGRSLTGFMVSIQKKSEPPTGARFECSIFGIPQSAASSSVDGESAVWASSFFLASGLGFSISSPSSSNSISSRSSSA